MNELLWAVTVLINFGLILLAYRLFGKVGLYGWIVLVIILANIQVLKTVELFGMVTTTGNILFATSFLVTDILNEIYGRKAARRAVLLGFFGLISATIVMQLTLQVIPHSSDWAQGSLETIFGIFPRVALASATAYLISQFHDVWAYSMWRKKFSTKRQIWIRNNLSTMISQAIDTAVFCFIAFWNVFPIEVFWDILITTYFLKWIVAASDTPFIYVARWMFEKGRVSLENEQEKAIVQTTDIRPSA